MRTLQRRRRGERGETLIEFSLIVVLCLMTLLGTVQFGIAIWRYNLLSDLAQEGARWASVRGSTSGTQKATAAQVQSFVQSRAFGLNINVTTSADPQSLAPGEVITVSVRNTLPQFSRLLPTSTLTMGSTAQMIIAR